MNDNNRVLENGFNCPPKEMSVCSPLPQWKYLVMRSYNRLPNSQSGVRVENQENSVVVYDNYDKLNQSDRSYFGHHIPNRTLRQWN